MSDKNAARRVRPTFQPDGELEVGPAEYLDLKRQGLLVDDGETEKKTSGRKANDTKEG